MKKNITADKHIFKGFTLLETVLTIIIMSILISLIFQIFVVIGRIAVYIQQQQQVHHEVIYVTQTIQNLVDDQSVVMTGYDTFSLSGSSGYDTTLRLADDTSVYEFSKECSGDDCVLNMRIEPVDFTPGVDDAVETELTDDNNVFIQQFVVKVLPYKEQDSFEETMHDGFWLFINARSPLFDASKWWYRVDYQGQLFFNPRKY